MKKILLSLLSIGAVAVVAVFATQAFFSDEEKSVGNTFVAGALDLKVDNTCHYNEPADDSPNCPTLVGANGDILRTWTETDLGLQHKFFYFTDVKPGDYGEDTISLHVDNDAWLRLVIDVTEDLDKTCTEPESKVIPTNLDPECTLPTPAPGPGELRNNLVFSMWLDQGAIPGFGGQANDPTECDNIKQPSSTEPIEPEIIAEGPINPTQEIWDLSLYTPYSYLKGGETACFGVAWKLPSTVGNEVQTDSFVGDMTFQVQQHRNNPTPTWTP